MDGVNRSIGTTSIRDTRRSIFRHRNKHAPIRTYITRFISCERSDHFFFFSQRWLLITFVLSAPSTPIVANESRLWAQQLTADDSIAHCSVRSRTPVRVLLQSTSLENANRVARMAIGRTLIVLRFQCRGARRKSYGCNARERTVTGHDYGARIIVSRCTVFDVGEFSRNRSRRRELRDPDSPSTSCRLKRIAFKT